LQVAEAPSEVLLQLEVVDGRIDVPLSIEAVGPHRLAISAEEHSLGGLRNESQAVQPVPDAIAVPHIDGPRGVDEVVAIEVGQR